MVGKTDRGVLEFVERGKMKCFNRVFREDYYFMIKVCVCDDDVTIANRICIILESLSREKSIEIKTDVFYDGITLIDNLDRYNSMYDIIFLDIEMKDLNGIETAKQLRLRDEFAYIIYVTSHENYAIETFSVRPYQFVLKPFKDVVIEKHFLDIYEKLSDVDEYFEFKYNKAYYKLHLNDIMFFESQARRIIIHIKDGKTYEYYDRLDNVKEKVNNSKSDFLRIHKSTLVNSKYIKIKSQNEVELMDGTILAISDNKRKEINEHYMKKVEERMRNGISN